MLSDLNSFTVRLFAGAAERTNRVVGPAGVLSALRLLYPAARRETRTSFSLPAGPFSALDVRKVRAALWVTNRLPWSTEYMRLVREGSGAATATVDYADPETVKKEINDWFGGPGNFPPLPTDGAFVSTSATFYSGTFTHRFEPARTRKQPFTLASGKQADCQMMARQGEFSYDCRKEYEVVHLPGENVLTAILPTGPLAEVEGKILERLPEILRGGKVGDGVVMLPKFRMVSDFDLKSPLSKMGVDFSDFSGAVDSGSVGLTALLDRVSVEVTEAGGESNGGPGRLSKVFLFDRPFLFVVWNQQTGLISFLGRHELPEGF